MKILAGFLSLIVLAQVCKAQYYYKDVVSTRENAAQWQTYKDNHVRSVKLSSFEGDGQPTEGFQGDQQVAADFSSITTHSKSSGTPESWIIATYSPRGLTLKITDTSDTYRSVSEYQYDSRGRLQSIVNTSIETDNQVKDVETHLWQYEDDASDKPSALLKIKNGIDTTFVRFVRDEKGNIAEERAVRNKSDLPTIYYYYDADNRLTDIVRYSMKAKRLLPDNIFEYGEGGRLSSLLAVQEGAVSYQKWLYAYNEKGLKIKESCFSKERDLLGRIEYQYTYK
jgi:YD repeat-containing protein